MKNQKPLLGLCPIGKFVFSNEDAVRYKELIRSKLDEWGVHFTDIDGVVEDGLVKDQKQVDAVAKHFKAAEIDCLFLPHCNFGTEGAAGMIAKKLGRKVDAVKKKASRMKLKKSKKYLRSIGRA